MSEIKFLSKCSIEEQQAVYQLYLASFGFYKVPYDDVRQSALMADLFQADWFEGLIYFDAGIACGFCFYIKTYSSLQASICFQVQELFVNPEYANRGIGTQLIQSLVEHSQQNQIPIIFLTVDASGAGNMAFYERLGFEPRKHAVLVNRFVGNIQ